MITQEIFTALRREYAMMALDENSVTLQPTDQFHIWFQNAIEAEVPECSAMVLSTCGHQGQPSSRVVLLKEYNANGFIFYTNYNSRKGIEIGENSDVALLFFWKELERQIRIEGIAEKISPLHSEEYFHSRPRESQIGALASNQSSVIENRAVLEKKYNEIERRYSEIEIPAPIHWGGYIVRQSRMEFWQGRKNRLHDRICYKKIDTEWNIERLSP